MAIEDYRGPAEGGNFITGPVKLAKGGNGNVSPKRKGNVAPHTLSGKYGEPPETYSSVEPGPNFYDCGPTSMKNILGYLN